MVTAFAEPASVNLESQTEMDKPQADPDHVDLISTRKLSKNVLLNLFAEGVPLLVSLFCIPVLVHRLGTEQFGILTLAWAIIGYFGIFDMGLGRALSKLVAEKLGRKDYESIPALFWTGLLMMGILGLMGAAILGGGASFAVVHILSISPEFQHETLIVLYLLAATIPFVIGSSAMVGVLSAYQRFDLIVKIRMPLGSWMFLGPVIAVLVFHTLVSVVWMMVLGRCLMFVLAALMCRRAVSGLHKPILRRDVLKSLFSFGGWVTVSNIISPIMAYMDRFFIAAAIGLSAVAYYATPYTVTVKFQIIPSILLMVLFPALSTMFAFDRVKARRTFEVSGALVLSAMLPVAIIVVGFAGPGLSFWLGKDFASHSELVLQILMVGILLNSLAFVPYASIQADGRPDITAILHLIELPVYLAILWFALHAWGIVGAAAAWTVRAGLDWVLLLSIGSVKVKSGFAIRQILLTVGLLCSLLGMAQANNLIVRGVLCIVIMIVFIVLSWRYLLDVSGRNDMKRIVHATMSRLRFV